MSQSTASLAPVDGVRFSVVIPSYNEEENVIPLAEEVIATLRDLPGGYELILVDDASTDKTASVIRQLEAQYPTVRGVFHRVNAGQSAAVASGFQAARGEWVGTLDGDGQNDPADLPGMLALAEKQGVDCVTGVRVARRSALREVPVFNGLHRFLPTLLRGQGFTVIETPVNHRERMRGVSKYGVHNRLWRGIRDCFGVRWYLARAVRADRLELPAR